MSSARSAGASRATAPGSLSPNALARAAALERAGDFPGALAAYEAAVGMAPDNPDVLAALATFAGRIEMFDVAARLWEQVSLLDPQRLEAIEGRARAWRELGAFEQAIALLRVAILEHPQDARLWNSLGVTLLQNSQAGLAIVFFDEAIRLDGRYAAALHNRGNARFDLGALDAAAADFERARKAARKPPEVAAIGFAAAALTLARGDLATGWEAYEARLSRNHAKAMVFNTPGRRWQPGQELAGKHLLVVGEQGLGDEIMFANLAPDVMEALGPDGRLTLAVEPRLVELFRRSFPAATVTRHVTDQTGPKPRRAAADLDGDLEGGRPVDLWAPMGSLPRQFRRAHADFPSARAYLRPDPARVAHWRGWLGPGPPAVGVSWRSGKMLGDRRRQYPPPDLWAPILALPGVRFVNVQYGDCADELARFRQESGCEILEPPGLDLREDIDDLAALLVALDLTLCVGNATGALAGACGAPVAIISPPAAWPRLGTDAFPWYPAAHAVTPPAYGDWAPAMAEAATLVSGLVRS